MRQLAGCLCLLLGVTMRGAFGYTAGAALRRWPLSAAPKSPFSARIRPAGLATALAASRRALATAAAPEVLQVLSTKHPRNNVGDAVKAKVGRNLHLTPNHPLNIIKTKIEQYLQAYAAEHSLPPFAIFDNLSPIVPVKNNFDDLLIPADHVSRKPSDTYYIDDDRVLRTHTSAHQSTFIKQGLPGFLVTGDVYRRDEIDASHYPVFHQMEGVRLFERGDLPPYTDRAAGVKAVEDDLKSILGGLARHLFGDVEMRWVDTYFPFTNPSFELEVFFKGDWLEVLGCGVIEQEIIRHAGKGEQLGWAFGLGLERLAMVLFSIPDIRLFWSEDPRFLDQFKSGEIVKFKEYSKYPPVYKDVSFWIPQGMAFEKNDVYEIVRGVAGDLVEKVELIDEFVHPKTQRTSHCYRIMYRHMDRTLTNDEIDAKQEIVRELIASTLKVELR